MSVIKLINSVKMHVIKHRKNINQMLVEIQQEVIISSAEAKLLWHAVNKFRGHT